MKILGIETSCDDTGIAILEILPSENFSVKSNLIASQIAVHKKYGGVFPAMAKREHQKNIVPVFAKSLKTARLLKIKKQKIEPTKLKTIERILEREPELLKHLILFLEKYEKPKVDTIAVTNGPGLEPCLWVGVNFARAISYYWNLPIISVNHIEGHILVNYLAQKKINLPAVSLVVSGGHTQIILMKKIGQYQILGETRDDAAGECFDKCAQMLGLSYPGGPVISQLAKKFKGKNTITLPRPMMHTKDYDFSFSGLKTAVLYADRKIKNKNQTYKIAMAHEIQQSIIDVLLKKTLQAAKDYKAKTIILGGGVSANQELKKQFAKKIATDFPKIKLLFPEPALSTDNALMIAITGYFHKKTIISWQKLKANANLRVG